MTRFSNEKYARYEVNIQRKCENKRVDKLFKMIEQQNTVIENFHIAKGENYYVKKIFYNCRKIV